MEKEEMYSGKQVALIGAGFALGGLLVGLAINKGNESSSPISILSWR